MRIETVSIDGTDYSFALLELKAGQQMITIDGRFVDVAYLGIMNINSIEETTNYQENWTLGVWETVEKYKGFLKNEQYTTPVNHFPVTFNGGVQSVDITELNDLQFNKNWLFGREISGTFLNTILAVLGLDTRWGIY